VTIGAIYKIVTLRCYRRLGPLLKSWKTLHGYVPYVEQVEHTVAGQGDFSSQPDLGGMPGLLLGLTRLASLQASVG